MTFLLRLDCILERVLKATCYSFLRSQVALSQQSNCLIDQEIEGHPEYLSFQSLE
jgi:hypothetical protein